MGFKCSVGIGDISTEAERKFLHNSFTDEPESVVIKVCIYVFHSTLAALEDQDTES